MSKTSQPEEECFVCTVCEKPFRSPIFSINKAFERTIFMKGDAMPEVEVIRSQGIESCCSSECLEVARERALEKENVRATFPDIGPIELCSCCGKPVDMTEFHLTWSEDESNCYEGQFIDVLQPVNVQVLAVACQSCAPAPPLFVESSADIKESKQI